MRRGSDLTPRTPTPGAWPAVWLVSVEGELGPRGVGYLYTVEERCRRGERRLLICLGVLRQGARAGMSVMSTAALCWGEEGEKGCFL